MEVVGCSGSRGTEGEEVLLEAGVEADVVVGAASREEEGEPLKSGA